MAVKLLAPGAEQDDAAARSRFEREIRILGELSHPNVVQLLDSGIDDELGPYLVTPLLPGQSARELVGGARLCPEAALMLAAPVVDALVALHAVGLVHRDLKPENIMTSPTGEVVVVDLGLAYRADHTRYTEEGAVVGSVPYMSPEQVEGHNVWAASDVWSVAVMIYEWIAGRRPFERERPSEEAAAILVGAFTPLKAADRRVGEELSDVIAQCLQRDPRARPSAEQLRDAVRAMCDWFDAAAAAEERAAVIGAPVDYQARVAPLRVARLRRLANEAVDGGHSFAALKLIDRGLAYAPDDAELRALSEAAEQAGAAAVPTAQRVSDAMAPPRTSHKGAFAIAGAVLAAGVAVAIAMTGGDDAAAPAAKPAPEAASAEEPGADMALEMFGGMMNLMERGIAAQEKLESKPPAASLTAASLDDLPPLSPESLSNDDEPRPIDLEAGDDRLVPVRMLGGQDPDATAADFDQKAKDHPDDVEWLVGRALVYLAAGRTKAGLGMLDDLTRTHADDAGVWAAVGFVELRRGRWKEADAALSRAIDLDPRESQSMRNRGILRHRQGRTRDAYADLTNALKVDPDDVDAMSELVRIYERADKTAEARPLLERITRARPRSLDAWLDLALVLPPAEALVAVRRAEKLAPNSPRVHKRLCTVLSKLANPDAIASCTAVVEANRKDPGAYMERGLAHYALGDDAAALADMDRAIAMRPDDVRFLQNRYIVRAHAGRDDARADLERACKLGSQVACTELTR